MYEIRYYIRDIPVDGEATPVEVPEGEGGPVPRLSGLEVAGQLHPAIRHSHHVLCPSCTEKEER